MVPFSIYEFTMQPDIEQLNQRLSTMWDLPSLVCPFNISSHFLSNSGFNVNWMQFQIKNEIRESQNNFKTIRNKTSMSLRPASELQAKRHRGGVGVGLAAFTVGLSRAVALEGSEICGLRDIFGGGHEEALMNAANMRCLSDYRDVLTQFVTEFSTKTDEKFFSSKTNWPP